MRSVATCNKTVVFCTETEYIVTRCAVMGCIADSYNHTEIPAGMCRNSSASSYPFTSLSVVYGCKNMNSPVFTSYLSPAGNSPNKVTISHLSYKRRLLHSLQCLRSSLLGDISRVKQSVGREALGKHSHMLLLLNCTVKESLLEILLREDVMLLVSIFWKSSGDD